MKHAEIEQLLGAYALDALDADERAAVDAHLPTCATCRDEVDRHRETTAMLSAAPGAQSGDLWGSIRAGLDTERPSHAGTAPVNLATIRDGRRSPAWRAAAATVAVAAAVLAISAGVAVRNERKLDHRISRLQTALGSNAREREITDALLDSSARQVTLRSPDDRRSVQLVYLADGTGYLVRDNLAPLAADRTYQLWKLHEGEAVSAGVLGAAPGVLAFKATGPADGFAITEEKAGGVVQSRHRPVVVGTI